MWEVGDRGQDSPWSRDTGVKMVKGANDVYTGEPSLPEGTKFDIKILKSTASTTSGGDNKWSAVKHAGTLNKSASHDFGESADNLIPNGDFDEGQKNRHPSSKITESHLAHSGPNVNQVFNKKRFRRVRRTGQPVIAAHWICAPLYRQWKHYRCG